MTLSHLRCYAKLLCRGLIGRLGQSNNTSAHSTDLNMYIIHVPPWSWMSEHTVKMTLRHTYKKYRSDTRVTHSGYCIVRYVNYVLLTEYIPSQFRFSEVLQQCNVSAKIQDGVLRLLDDQQSHCWGETQLFDQRPPNSPDTLVLFMKPFYSYTPK